MFKRVTLDPSLRPESRPRRPTHRPLSPSPSHPPLVLPRLVIPFDSCNLKHMDTDDVAADEGGADEAGGASVYFRRQRGKATQRALGTVQRGFERYEAIQKANSAGALYGWAWVNASGELQVPFILFRSILVTNCM